MIPRTVYYIYLLITPQTTCGYLKIKDLLCPWCDTGGGCGMCQNHFHPHFPRKPTMQPSQRTQESAELPPQHLPPSSHAQHAILHHQVEELPSECTSEALQEFILLGPKVWYLNLIPALNQDIQFFTWTNYNLLISKVNQLLTDNSKPQSCTCFTIWFFGVTAMSIPPPLCGHSHGDPMPVHPCTTIALCASP